MEEDNSISNEKSMMFLKLDDTISESESFIINDANNYESDENEKEKDKLDSNVNKTTTNNDLLMTSVISEDLSDNLVVNTSDPSLNQLNHNDSESSYITEDLVLLANDLVTTVIINNDNLNLVSHEEEVRTSYVDKPDVCDVTPTITFEINQEVNQRIIQEKGFDFSDEDDFDPDLPPPPPKFSTLKSSITIQKIPRIKPTTTTTDVNASEVLANKDEIMIQTVEDIPPEATETNHSTVNKAKKSNSPIVTYKKVKVTKLISHTAIFIFREEYDPSHETKPSSKLEATIKNKDITNEANECVILEQDDLLEDPDYLRYLSMKQNGTKTTISSEYANNIPQRTSKRKQEISLSSESGNETKKFKSDTDKSDSDDSDNEQQVVFVEEIEPKKINAKKTVQKPRVIKRSTPSTRNKPIAKSTTNKTRQTRANSALKTNDSKHSEKVDDFNEVDSIYSASISTRTSSVSTSPSINKATTSKSRQTRTNKALKIVDSDHSEKNNDLKAADSIYSASISSRTSSLSSSPSIESINFEDKKTETKKQEKTPFKSIGNSKPKKSPELFDFSKIKIDLTSKKKTVAKSQNQSKLTEINDKGLSIRVKQINYEQIKNGKFLYKNSNDDDNDDDEGDETLSNTSSLNHSVIPNNIVKQCTVNLIRLPHPGDGKKAKTYK